MTFRSPGKFSLDDPVTLQLFHNFVAGLIPPNIIHFNSLLKTHTEEEIQNFKLTSIISELLQDKIIGKVRSSVSSAVQLLLRTGTLEIDPVQMKVFFLQLRCYMEQVTTVMNSDQKIELHDPYYYSSAINGITVVTEKLANRLKATKKDHLQIGNNVEKWIKVGLTCHITSEVLTGRILPNTRFTSTGIESLNLIVRQIESDAFDVLDKLEFAINTGNFALWSLQQMQIVVCQLAKQARDITLTGSLSDSNPKSYQIASFLNSSYFSKVVQHNK
ncbi:hypothetical protein FO519_006863 [Halicephalobus sp. NKZ332]|nr:hypothetical protein FO519_006863 [Halicephalobus sp. NKZ332]